MFPAPIGGIALPSEFPACITFIVLYGLLVPVIAYRFWDRRSRTILLIGAVIAATERTVVLSLRAVGTQREDFRFSEGLVKYGQTSLGFAFVGIGLDLAGLLRCLLVNSTYGYGEGGRWDESPSAATKGSSFRPPSEGDLDRPLERARWRKVTFCLRVSFLLSNIPGGIAAGMFQKKYFDNMDKARMVCSLRYAGAAIAVALIAIVISGALWSWKRQPRAPPKAIHRILLLSSLILIVGIYRLSVMHYETPALESTLPGTLNGHGAKAAFYIFHLLPEWVCLVILLCFNTRKTFGTGPWGDRRLRDDTPEKIRERMEKKARHDARNGANSDTERGNTRLTGSAGST
ncbi:hypothetical protein DFP72DRAFT_1124414 [Ephemerocybe angulata]|uniref:Uncharacterized protein n=1 Tax=Ephemerocybe angulata TaxID=980116 RepID=A0A8H6M789_9AGAR|nr:hypothetical protein DFP72DRAFT_1124414 [Tulosesus angulatus]